MTICTGDRACIFDDAWMNMVAERAWRSVMGTRPQPYEFVVMPNHVHGIIWLRGIGASEGAARVDGAQRENQGIGRAEMAPLKMGAAPLRVNVAQDSLGAVVRAFKAATTRRIKRGAGRRARRSGSATIAST